jgi:hypothetical protein
MANKTGGGQRVKRGSLANPEGYTVNCLSRYRNGHSNHILENGLSARFHTQTTQQPRHARDTAMIADNAIIPLVDGGHEVISDHSEFAGDAVPF